MKKVAVGEICNLINGKAFKPEDWSEQGQPIIRIQNLNDTNKPFKFWSGSLDRQVEVKTGDVLFAWSGTPGTSFGVHIWNRGSGILNQHIFRVDIDHSCITAEWFKYAVNDRLHELIAQAHGGVGLQHVTRPMVERLQIPLPPLSEQKRIAAILDKADALRRKRRQALALLDSLTQSIFLEMFGDPAAAAWPFMAIGEVAKDIRTGPFGSQLLHSEFVDEGIAVLGIDNAVNNRFEWGKARFITEDKYRALKRYTVKPGDVLITIMGTCGRCAVVPEGIPLAVNTKHICCITLDQRRILPQYLHACFLTDQSVLRQLGVQAKGAVMPGLNMGIIKSLIIPIPPLHLQERFAHAVAVVEAQIDVLGRARSEDDALFTSLQHRAFTGQL